MGGGGAEPVAKTVCDNPKSQNQQATQHIARELFEALDRLLGAIEADVQIAPGMDVQTSYETNGMALEQARAALRNAALHLGQPLNP